MSRRDISLYFDDILKAIERIEAYTQGLTLETFSQDQKTIDAVVRNLSIIGEAVGNIPDDTRRKYPAVPWHEILGMRNKVIHEYFGVDEQIVWQTVKEDLPQFLNHIRSIPFSQE